MAYRDSTTASGNSDTPSVSVPAGVASGDIVVLVAAIDASAAVFDTGDYPSGFTELHDVDVTFDGHSVSVSWKRLTGSDAGSYTFGALGASGDWICQAYAFSGRDPSNPPTSTSNIQNSSQSSPVTVTATGVTALDQDDLLWISAPDVNLNDVGTGHTAPSGYSEKEDAENAWSNLSGATKENVSAGATGSVSGTFTMSGNNCGWAAFLIRIPADTGPAGGYILQEDGFKIALEDGSGFLIQEETEAGGTTFNQDISGSITPAGALIKQDQKRFTGTITPTGAVIKQDQKRLTGTITPAGSLLKSIAKTLTGTITPAGALAVTKVILRSFAGTITPAGALIRQANKALSGLITPAGALIRQTQKRFTGTITPAGTVATIKAILRTFTGTITPAGTLIRQDQKQLTGTITPAGSLLKSTLKRFTATITPAGAVAATKVILRSFAGTITPGGALIRRAGKVLAGSITPTGVLFKAVSKLFSGIITLAGNLFNFVAGAPLVKVFITVSDRAVTPTSAADQAAIRVAISDTSITAIELSDSRVTKLTPGDSSVTRISASDEIGG